MERWACVILVALVSLWSGVSVSASAAKGVGSVSVAMPTQPLISHDLHIHLRAGGRLPRGAYFYAIAVLRNYRHYSPQAPPLCAISSDMERMEYGVSHSGKAVNLTLRPASAPEGHWCPGTYTGAIYAVIRPNQLCDHKANCYRRTGKLPIRIGTSSQDEQEPYSYPGGLPRPVGRSTRVIGHFHVTFVTAITPPGRHRIPRVDGPICPAWGISLPCRCPREEVPPTIDPTRGIANGYGWVEITLSYSRGPLGLGSCPGGIAIEGKAGQPVASAGYTSGPFGAESGIPPGSTTTFVLASGTWRALGFAGRESSTSTTFVVAAGHGTKITIALP
jgi:hypothetical protein